MKYLLVMAGVLLLQGCNTFSQKALPEVSADDKAKLSATLDALPADHKARHASRNPEQTVTFFGIKPGDTVVEALPGGGWYSKVLVPYLGDGGRLVGVDYGLDMWPHFGDWATPEFVASRQQWLVDFPQDAQEWGRTTGAMTEAYTFATLPEELKGKADYVLYIRAMHNLARFEDKGGYLTQALQETHRLLKAGGHVGIVQHAIDEEKPDAWAKGDRGYLKRSFIISAMEANGFELVAESDVNLNAKDDVQEGDVVWRLPPSLRTDDANKAKNKEIGESNRVTLLFKKKAL